METKVRDLDALQHIKEYCDEVSELLVQINNDRQQYDNLRVYKHAIALCVLQIGELVRIISPEYKESHPEVPWKEIIGMRNIVAHAYGTFDYDTLWDVATEDIPSLKAMCEKYLDEKQESDDSQNEK